MKRGPRVNQYISKSRNKTGLWVTLAALVILAGFLWVNSESVGSVVGVELARLFETKSSPAKKETEKSRQDVVVKKDEHKEPEINKTIEKEPPKKPEVKETPKEPNREFLA
jgi:hypothetical protein